MPSREEEEKLAIVKKAVAGLSEHFDAVHVFATYQDKENSQRLSWGCGNYFTRYGLAATWLKLQDLPDDGPPKESFL